MKKMMKYRFPVLLLLLILIGSNISAKKLNKINLAYLYNENKFTDFEAEIFHVSDKRSTIFINIRLNDFHYLQNMNDGSQLAKFKVKYEIYESWESKVPIDTANLIFTDDQSNTEKMDVMVDFDIKADYPNNYLLKIVLFDLNRIENNTIAKFYDIRKTNAFSSQNFLVIDEDGYPIYDKSISSDQYYKVKYNDTSTIQLVVRYYNVSFPLAKPPFAPEKEEIYEFEPDSIFTIPIQNGITELLELPYYGIYHFQADISQTNGLTLFRFDDGFPEITEPVQAVVPLRYLTTEKEFNKLLRYENYKMAVDSFWLTRSSNQPERAKNMINRFYSRVQEANKIFSSYHEGWKTDRGIIYIIYGPPSEVYRNDNEEEWIYGERGNPMSIRFYFNAIENPFTTNEQKLERSASYKSSWYIAIENWRR